MEKKKITRHRKLKEYLLDNAFLTDEQLAELLKVSVQTVRLDRQLLKIPELRGRVKNMAENAANKLKAIDSQDVVGELLDLELGVSGVSVLTVGNDMINKGMGIVRSNHIFAQANSLALALVDATAALTGVANVKYKKPVFAGERLVAKAKVTRTRANKSFISVSVRSKDLEVFKAKFIIVALNREESETG